MRGQFIKNGYLKMKRRDFLHQVAVGGVALAGGAAPFGLARIMAPQEAKAAPVGERLRPPGALLNDADFIAACIGCGLCGEACPTHAIQFYSREGGDKVNTPFIDPTVKACSLSGECMKVCPTNALTVTPREEVKMGYAQIDRTACYPWVDRGVCGACVSICPLGKKGIDFAFANFYRPVVLEGCVGCGLCVQICPHPSVPIRIVARSHGVVAVEAIEPLSPIAAPSAESKPATSLPGLVAY